MKTSEQDWKTIQYWKARAEAAENRVAVLEEALTSALGGWEAAPPEVQDDYVDIEALRRVAKHRSEVEPGPDSYPAQEAKP